MDTEYDFYFSQECADENKKRSPVDIPALANQTFINGAEFTHQKKKGEAPETYRTDLVKVGTGTIRDIEYRPRR